MAETQEQGFTLGQQMGLASLGTASLQALLSTSPMKRQVGGIVDQVEEQTTHTGKQVRKLMGQQTLSYLKRGVNISGSAKQVIKQTGIEGVKEISNQVEFAKAQIKDVMRGYRNQLIGSLVGAGAQLGVSTYAANQESKGVN